MSVERRDWFGWIALSLALISLAFIVHGFRSGWLELYEWRILMISGPVSFVLGIVGVAKARSGWSKAASALAIPISLVVGAVLFVASALADINPA